MRRWAGFLSGDEASFPLSAAAAFSDDLSPRRHARIVAEREHAARDLLAATEERLRAGFAPMDLISADGEDERLNLAKAVALRFTRRDPAEALREAAKT